MHEKDALDKKANIGMAATIGFCRCIKNTIRTLLGSQLVLMNRKGTIKCQEQNRHFPNDTVPKYYIRGWLAPIGSAGQHENYFRLIVGYHYHHSILDTAVPVVHRHFV